MIRTPGHTDPYIDHALWIRNPGQFSSARLALLEYKKPDNFLRHKFTLSHKTKFVGYEQPRKQYAMYIVVISSVICACVVKSKERPRATVQTFFSAWDVLAKKVKVCVRSRRKTTSTNNKEKIIISYS